MLPQEHFDYVMVSDEIFGSLVVLVGFGGLLLQEKIDFCVLYDCT